MHRHIVSGSGSMLSRDPSSKILFTNKSNGRIIAFAA